VIDFVTDAPTAGSMDVVWQHRRTGDVAIQVHYCDPHAVILRQSKAFTFEARAPDRAGGADEHGRRIRLTA